MSIAYDQRIRHSYLECEIEMQEVDMATAAQRSAAKRNIKKAAAAARRKRTIAHLPKATRTVLGKQGAATRKKR